MFLINFLDDTDSVEATIKPRGQGRWMLTKTRVDPNGPRPLWQGIVAALFPALAAGASFLTWLDVGLSSQRSAWTAYTVTTWSWIWLGLDLLALLSAVLRPSWSRAWVRRAWGILGAASFGVGLTIGQSVHVSARVSDILGAPNPVHLATGVVAFVVVTGLWTVSALVL